MEYSASAARLQLEASPMLHFLPDFQQALDGEIQTGGRLTIAYSSERTGCGIGGRLDSFVRFNPAGELYQAESISFSVSVPLDATEVELWFLSSNAAGCRVWDSRYGENYSFPVVGPSKPMSNVLLRAGAIEDPGMVNTFQQTATKVVRFFTSDPSDGRELDTRLALRAWVRNTAFEKSVWVDLHVFDNSGAQVQAGTFPLHYVGPGGGNGDVFTFAGGVYQGSGGGPGSGWNHPDARNVQYRLYFEVNGQLFTDGVLHEDEVDPDDVVWNAAQ